MERFCSSANSPLYNTVPCKSLRSVSCIKQAACVQVLGSDSADGPWLKAITERVMNIYCERLSGYAWCSQASLLTALASFCIPVTASLITADASLQQCASPLDACYPAATLSTPTMYHCVILINSRVHCCGLTQQCYVIRWMIPAALPLVLTTWLKYWLRT